MISETMHLPDEAFWPDWKWKTPDGTRAIERWLGYVPKPDSTFREKIEWLEAAENTIIHLHALGVKTHANATPPA
jgi:hypothetical protein